MAARGVEPLTDIDVSDDPRRTCTDTHCILAAPALQACGTNCPFRASIDKELLELIESWAVVPQHARVAILSLGRWRIEK